MHIYIQHPELKIIQVQRKRGHYLSPNAKSFSTIIKFVTLYKAINNIPNSYRNSTLLLKNELISLSSKNNGAFNMLSVFNVRSRKNTSQKTKQK